MTLFFYVSIVLLFLAWGGRLKLLKTILRREYFLTAGQESVTGVKPTVSVLIPARNEEKNIERCVQSLINQDYKELEIIVINDRSTDNTAQIVEKLALQDERITLLTIDQCPDGWSGKNNALSRGVEIATGSFFVFTDADTHHRPSCIGTALGYAMKNQVDLLSLNPHLVTNSFWENVIMPIAGAVLMIWYPIELINNHGNHRAYANGQFIMMTREAYERTGGHKAVKTELLEDLALALKIKQAGMRLRVLWAPELYSTHMYTSFQDIWRGWVRIFLHGLYRSVTKMAASLLLMFFFSLLPYVLLFIALIMLPQLLPVILVAILFAFISIVIRKAYTAADANPLYIGAHILGCIIVAAILFHAMVTVITKRNITWRGIAYTSA